MYDWPSHDLDGSIINQLPDPTTDLTDSVGNSVGRSKMESGHVRQRLRATAGMRTIQVSWDLDSAQKAAFEGIVKYFINGGADWFNMRLDLGSGYQTYVVRFVEGKYRSSYVPVSRWRVSATLETQNTSILTAEQTEDYLTPPI